MILIAGLGNPGEKYKRTRHNVGFMFVEYLLQNLITDYKLGTTNWKHDKYSNAETATTKLIINDHELTTILAKPQTYMNRSGESIRLLAQTHSLLSQKIIVAHDDLDILLGKFKIQEKVGPKKHNGLSSIENHLHASDFLRIRIGVDNRQGDRSISGEEYVLQNFSHDEMALLDSAFSEMYNKLLTFFSHYYL